MTEPGSRGGHSQSYGSNRKRGETKACDMQSMHTDGFNSSRGEPNNTASALHRFRSQYELLKVAEDGQDWSTVML